MSPAAYKPVALTPMIKGLIASTDYATQPKGSFPRASDFLLNKRGALDVCDGSQLVHAFNGAVQANRGKCMEPYLFSPTGVSSYYLALMKILEIHLGAPQNLVATPSAGGTLSSGQTYFYKVTALDGAGGETTASSEASATPSGGNLSVTLTWNVVPNAVSYNVYRGVSSGNERLLFGTGLPVAQVAAGTLSVTFIDNGSANPTSTGTISNIVLSSAIFNANLSASIYTYILTATAAIATPLPPQTVNVSANSNANLNTGFVFLSQPSSTTMIIQLSVFAPLNPAFQVTGNGGTYTFSVAVPSSDNTQQVALYQMPVIPGSPAPIPISYNNGNIVAFFPADIPFGFPIGGGGGSGGGGGTGGGGSSGGSATPSGGVQGNTSLIPQMISFTNRVAIALGNGFPLQLFSDPTTAVNPATIAVISAISVDAFGVVTVTTATPHGLSSAQVGGNVVIAGVTNSLYNGTFPTINIVSTTQYKVRNLAAIGQGASSGGTSTTTAVPIISTFVPAFPTWAATTAYSTNSIVQPSPTNGFYYIAIQGGTSGGAQPTFPTTIGQQVADGSVIWQCKAATNTAAPPPPGAAHIFVYAGSLWAWNTSPTNTSTGLDGPCSLRMSDVNNPNSWNPINQAFLDKDDGTEGMGLFSFTITAQGIPPEGSLVAFKNYASYQIVGIFGSPTLTIQRIKTDMGCLAPRSLQFIPGFGLKRFTHLGFAVFDGVEDRVTSEDIRPFLFPTGDQAESDITVLDANWQSVMWGFQTAQPPMYCAAIPIGSSSGQLTRILCYDLVLKAWTGTIDLPFPIGSAAQFRTVSANPVTILGGYSDGCLSRWQAGDQQWDVGATGARTPSAIAWNVRLPETLAQNAENKLNCRRLAIRGINTGATSPIKVTVRINGVSKWIQNYTIPASGDFEVFASFMRDGLRFSAIISGSGKIELDRFTFHITQKEVGAASVLS